MGIARMRIRRRILRLYIAQNTFFGLRDQIRSDSKTPNKDNRIEVARLKSDNRAWSINERRGTMCRFRKHGYPGSSSVRPLSESFSYMQVTWLGEGTSIKLISGWCSSLQTEAWTILCQRMERQTTTVVVTNGDPPFQKFTGSSIRSKDQNQTCEKRVKIMMITFQSSRRTRTRLAQRHSSFCQFSLHGVLVLFVTLCSRVN